jgi:hypothetical protein
MLTYEYGNDRHHSRHFYRYILTTPADKTDQGTKAAGHLSVYARCITDRTKPLGGIWYPKTGLAYYRDQFIFAPGKLLPFSTEFLLPQA